MIIMELGNTHGHGGFSKELPTCHVVLRQFRMCLFTVDLQKSWLYEELTGALFLYAGLITSPHLCSADR